MSSDTVRFGALFAEPQRNGLTRPKKVRGQGLPMVNMGELFAVPRIRNLAMDLVPVANSEQHYLLQPGDLLFARQSLVLSGAGQCSIFLGNTAPTVFESHLIRCRLDRGLANPNFYFYFFRSPAGRQVMETIVEQGAGAAGIRGSDLVNVEVPHPELRVQNAIAELLGAVDDRITLLRETNATLEAIAQALFKSWFVDFDPVRAKRDGRAPEGMDETTAALFPDSFEDSELGEVPSGWHIRSIDALMRLHRGSVNPANAPEKCFQHFSLPAYDDGQTPVVQLGAEIKSNKTSVPQNAVMLSKLNPHIPRVWLPSSINAEAVCSTEFLVFVPTQVSTTNFVYSLLNAPEFCGRLCQLVTGTSNSHQRVKPESVLSLPQVVPSPECIRAYDTVVEELYARLKLNREMSRKLSELRDILLPRLISGQLRLPEAADAIESALA